jgi:hypothetical protein
MQKAGIPYKLCEVVPQGNKQTLCGHRQGKIHFSKTVGSLVERFQRVYGKPREM